MPDDWWRIQNNFHFPQSWSISNKVINFDVDRNNNFIVNLECSNRFDIIYRLCLCPCYRVLFIILSALLNCFSKKKKISSNLLRDKSKSKLQWNQFFKLKANQYFKSFISLLCGNHSTRDSAFWRENNNKNNNKIKKFIRFPFFQKIMLLINRTFLFLKKKMRLLILTF